MFEDQYTSNQAQKMLPRESKLMLANVIRHTDTHNRIIEEEECWKQRALQRVNEAKEFNDSSDKNGKKCKWLLESRRVVGKSRAHMDCKDDIQSHRYEGREEEARGTFWMRQLDNFESRDPERWGHSGYKELYPQDFLSDSEKDNVTQLSKYRSSKKRPHSTEPEVKKKHKKSHSDRKLKEKKKKSKKKKRDSGSHESGTKSRKERYHKKQKEEIDCSSHKNKSKLCKKKKKITGCHLMDCDRKL